MAAGSNATLQVEVVSTGIKDTVSKLDSLGYAAERNEKKVRTLTGSLDALMKMQENAVVKAAQHSNLMSAIANAMHQVSNAANATAKQVEALSKHMGTLAVATDNVTHGLDRKAGKAGVVNTTLRAMATAASAYLSLGFAKSVVQSSDAWAMMAAKLKLATGSMESAVVVQKELYTLAQNIRVPIEDAAKLYTRMAIPMQKLGKTSADTMQMVEGVSLALQLGGSTAAEASSVMLQFSQAINAGRLNGAEFNAVAEAAPSILRAIETELRRTGQWGENTTETLKKMGSEGKISVELMQAALQNALPQWRKDFEELPLTVDSAMTTIVNAWKRMIGESTSLRSALNDLANLFVAISGFIEDLNQVSKDMDKQFGTSKTKIEGLSTSAKVFGTVLETLLVLGSDVEFVFSTIGRSIGATLAQLEALASGDFKGAAIIGVMARKDAELARKTLDEYQAKILGMTDRVNGKKTQTQSALALGAGLDTRAEDARFAASKPKDPYAGAAPLEDVRKYVKTRSDIIKEGQQQLLDTEKAFGKAIAGASSASARLELERELAERRIALAKETSDALKSYDKKDKGVDVDAYTKMVSSIKATTAVLSEQAKETEKLTQSERLYAELNAGKDAEFNKLSKSQKAYVLGMVQQNIGLEQSNAVVEASRKASEDLTRQIDKHNEAVQRTIDKEIEEAVRNEDKVAAFGKAKGAIEALELARLNEQLAQRASVGMTLDEIASLEKLIAAKERNAAAAGKLGSLESNKEASEALDKLLNADKAKTFGEALTAAFDQSNNALTKLTKGIDDYSKREASISDVREKVLKTDESEERTKKLLQLDKLEVKSKVRAAGDMAGAAKGFFKEHSKGYKAMEAVERTFRAFELASALQNNAVKLQGVWTYVAAKGQEIWAMITGTQVDTATTAVQVGNSMTKATASTAAGSAKAFEQMGVYGFIGAAAIVAFMASMGVSSGGSGSAPSLSEQRQKKQGTGSVLGMEDEKSASISNSLEILKENSDLALRHSSGMLVALQGIRDGITGMARFVAQSLGIRGMSIDDGRFGTVRGSGGFVGKSLSSVPLLGGLAGGLFGKVFGSKTTTTLKDSGIYIGEQSIGDVMSQGFSASSYADINRTKKKWYGSKKSSDWTEYGALDAALKQQMALTVESLVDGVTAAAGALGQNESAVRQQLENANLSATKISLKGLSGDEIAAELEAVFSKIGDDLASNAVGGLQEFQKVGEGYFETLVRVANGVEVARWQLDQLGVSMISFGDVTNKNGDVAAELVRDSLRIKEAGTSIEVLIGEIQGSASDLVGVYKQLVDVRSSMEFAGLGTNLTREILRGSGGLDNLQEAMGDFIDGFYSDAEKRDMASKRVAADLTRIGINNVPKTRQEFRELVTVLMAGDAAAQELAGRVLILSSVFNDAQEQLEDLVDTARSNLVDAYERERDVLADTQKKFEDFAKSLKEFGKSLLTGGLSPLTNTQKYAELAAKYNDTVNKARAGDEDAISKFQSVANEFLQFSREYNASGAAYVADFNNVVTETAYLATVAETQADVATQSLEALQKQVEGLITVNESVLTVAQAIEELHKAMTVAGMAIPTGNGELINGSHANGLSYVPFDGYTAELHKGEAVLTAAENREYQSNRSNESLIEEIKALRTEVAKLREEQADQTNRVIGANYDANERNAQVVVDGTKDAVSEASWKETNKLGIV